MTRNTARRVSRPLIGALGITIVIGAAVYLHKHHKPKLAAAHSAGTPVAIASAKPVDSKASVTKPDAKPATGDASASANSGGLLNATPRAGLVTETPTAGSTNNSASAKVAGAGANPPQPAVAPTTRPAGAASNNTAIASASDSVPNFPDTSTGGNALPVSADALVQGRKEKEVGHLLSARELINNSLLSGQLSEADADAARQMLGQISQDMLFGRKQVPGDPYTDIYQIQNGERLSKIADRHNVTWALLLRVNGMSDARRIQAGRSIKLVNGPFHAVVNKSKFRLDVYLGNPGGASSMFVMSMPVGLGRDDSTPTGLWEVQRGNKAHPATYYSPRGEGVIAADDPKNPLGGYWMGLSGVQGNAVGKSSYGIHGTIDPDSIGKQASMGCIRLRHEDIALLYDLLVDGKSKVVVKD
jgi:lipoprotein-anchoring transpeptidase ErfK/SrfK